MESASSRRGTNGKLISTGGRAIMIETRSNNGGESSDLDNDIFLKSIISGKKY